MQLRESTPGRQEAASRPRQGSAFSHDIQNRYRFAIGGIQTFLKPAAAADKFDSLESRTYKDGASRGVGK